MTDSGCVADVLRAFGLEGGRLEPITVGNINETYVVETPDERWVLQRLNPIFDAAVHLDIEAVTGHLARRGLATPRLQPTLAGELWFVDADGGVWRLMTHIDGVNHCEATEPRIAQGAGQWLGRFHRAVADLEHDFVVQRPAVHDTARHMGHLRRVLDGSRTTHPGYDSAHRIGEAVLAAHAPLPVLTGLPERVVHGDPKLNNFMFSRTGAPICLIDLDTVSRMPVPFELGDAFRSWCNPAGEDATDTAFELAALRAGWAGYGAGAGDLLSQEEIEAIPVAIETITLELAARFCADVLEEAYFGWNRGRFDAPWQHHRVRAKGQLRLARSFASQRGDVAALFSAAR